MAVTRLHFKDLLRRFIKYRNSLYKDRGPNKRPTIVRCLTSVEKLATKELLNCTLNKFSPKKLIALQQLMIDADWNQATVNQRVRAVQSMFRWAVAQEYVQFETAHALQCVDNIKLGDARVRPASSPEPAKWEDVERLLPFLKTQIADMVMIQWYTAMRAGELCAINMAEIDTTMIHTHNVWIYKPVDHKTAYRKIKKQIVLGPRAITLLQKYINWEQLDKPIFRKERKKRMGMTSNDFAHAINYGFKRAEEADVMINMWHPHQLRHAGAVNAERLFGHEAAAALLGDTIQSVNIYTKRNLQLATEVAQRCG